MLKTSTLESIVLGITYSCGSLRTVFWRHYFDLCNRKYEGEYDTMRFVLCSSVLVLWETM